MSWLRHRWCSRVSRAKQARSQRHQRAQTGRQGRRDGGRDTGAGWRHGHGDRGAEMGRGGRDGQSVLPGQRLQWTSHMGHRQSSWPGLGGHAGTCHPEQAWGTGTALGPHGPRHTCSRPALAAGQPLEGPSQPALRPAGAGTQPCRRVRGRRGDGSRALQAALREACPHTPAAASVSPAGGSGGRRATMVPRP